MVMKETVKRIQLSRDCISPSKASDMIQALINENVNFHKLERLSLMVGNENADTNILDNRINYLLGEKERLHAIVEDAKEQGYDLCVKTTIEIGIAR